MGDDSEPTVKIDGIHVGDFVIRPVPATSTDDHLDTLANRERDRQKEEDARAAQHREQAQKAPAEGVIPFGEGGDVDASIEEARARLQGGEQAVPIVLRDPLTGEPVGSV